ncbi:MAG: glycosyl transferase [Firmicutes bacterium]|nr:glycosyl transferase [Bacillota bacterium]
MLENIFLIAAVLVLGLGALRVRQLIQRPLPVEAITDALLGINELEQHARELATRHRVSSEAGRRGRRLPDPEAASQVLHRVYDEISRAVRDGYSPSPAAEWLLDNFYVISAGIRDLKGSMPTGYYRELPKLANGRMQGYPRVYALALELISHSDNRIDVETIERFFAAYQSVAPLTIGEIWAIPTFIRIGLTENLKYLALQVLNTQKERQEAANWLTSILQEARTNSLDLEDLVAVRARSLRRVSATFATELLYRLRNEGTDAAPLTEWLDQRLAAIGTSADEIVHLEHQRQSAREISVRNAINSLRTLAAIDWTESFERLSHVERILQTDPDGTYAVMDSASRDMYRHRVEKVARSLGISELQVARQAVMCASSIPADSREFWKRHVGYYLVDEGYEILLSRLGRPLTWQRRLRRSIGRYRFGLYLGSIALLTLLLTRWLYPYFGNAGFSTVIAGLIVTMILASDLAVRVVHGIITTLVPPRMLPKCELRHGIPDDHAAIVVIPALLPDKQRAHQLIDRLEVYYLANQDSNLFFALLGDLADAPQEKLPEDDEILKAAQERIRELNEKYAEDRPIFHFFYRSRLWNESEGCYMAWERKRGKLEEFNRVLRGARDTTYCVDELPDYLRNVQYVITLDADTGLPRDAARRLIGTQMHPLNRPVLDQTQRRVVRGYGLLQPRINIVATSTARSLFTRVFAGDGGVDPYTTAVSDVYQDLFGEGIYTGKGIYHVDTFNAVLGERLPDNAVLSHDLLEGSYLRAGLTTDIELIDGYPSRYDAYALRLHRWVRGDWQLLPWLFRTVPTGTKGTAAELNPLSALSRWKIFDNLRRSLIAPSLLAMIAGGLTVFPGTPLVYLGFAGLVVLFPWLMMIVTDLLGVPRGNRFLGHVWTMVSDSRKQAWQAFLNLTFLPYQAYLMLDAVVRTIIRVRFTRRHLLEWVTAADLEERLSGGWQGYWLRMWPGQLLAVLFLASVVFIRPENLVLAAPLVILWLASPWIADAVSRPITDPAASVTAEDRTQLRLYARQIWRYFEDFVGEGDNWLPPDHYQEAPKASIAHRTSPTNIGLYLLSILAARDLGYIGIREMLERVARSIGTIERLEKWHGHLYNWYDTRSLRPLRPFYISAVDSGNLVGYLITLRQGLLETLTEPLLDLGRWRSGLKDTFTLMSLEVRGETGPSAEAMAQFSKESETAPKAEARHVPSAVRAYTALKNLENRLSHLVKSERADNHADRFRHSWTMRLADMLGAYRQEIEVMFPWVLLLTEEPPVMTQETIGSHGYERWCSFLRVLDTKTSLLELPSLYRRALEELRQFAALIPKDQNQEKAELTEWLEKVRGALVQSMENAAHWTKECYRLAETIQELVEATDCRQLYDEKRQLFSIGYSLEEERLTRSYYDLLASEARQASFVAIAKGDVPQKHWFQLGRAMVRAGESRTLVSWSGTMFEYLMPLLIMHCYPNTLLAEACGAAVREQIAYARRHRAPWGISECGFSALNVQLHYQYQAFGVPSLGLKRGLARDLVVAPYATFLALMVYPAEACENLKKLAERGLNGKYGMYEAIDFTPDRVSRGETGSIVRMYMAHHLGMSLLALINCLQADIMRRRFHSDPYVQATDLLLQERLPRHLSVMERKEDTVVPTTPRDAGPLVTRRFSLADLNEIDVFLASNGAYSVMLTTAGSGYSRWEGISLNRWRRDGVKDQWGMFFYIKDLKEDHLWSATYQPTLAKPDAYEVEFADDRAEYVRWDHGIKTRLEMTVSSEHNAEVRRISLTNQSQESRLIEVTSFFEVVLDTEAADLAHPAFSNLFVQTEFLSDYDALLAYRRPRHENQQPLYLVHTVAVEGNTVGELEYETDRSRFIGRGGDLSRPEGVDGRLSGRVGAVLDPCMCLRRRIRIPPGKTVRLVYSTAVAKTREEAVNLAKAYHETDASYRAFALAWARSQVELRYLNLSLSEAHLFQTMAAPLIYGDERELKHRKEQIAGNKLGQEGLWAQGISGEIPIMAVKIRSQKDEETVRQALVAHEYWRMKGFPVDLVIINEEAGGYEQYVQDLVRQLITSCHGQAKENRPGGIFIKQASLMAPAEIRLLEAAARLVIGAGAGSLAEKARQRPSRLVSVSRRGLLARRRQPELISNAQEEGSKLFPAAKESEKLEPALDDYDKPQGQAADDRLSAPISMEDELKEYQEQLVFFNGFGGFTADGREYVILLREGVTTPAPWINVVSNPNAGFIISESGSGYTWAENSRENKLTPWSNDPVLDPPGEALYLQDLDTGELWSPTASPIREREPYIVAHGQGYSRFFHDSHGIQQTLWAFVPLQDPVKIYRLRLRNSSTAVRKLVVAFYCEVTLGVHRQLTEQQIITDFDEASRAVLARNSFRDNIYGHRVAFAATSLEDFSYTGNRLECIGRHGTMRTPAGMAVPGSGLSGEVGAGLDPCIAIKGCLELQPGEEKDVIFLLGEANSLNEVRKLVDRHCGPAQAEHTLSEVRAWWDETLNVVQVNTPNRGLNFMINRWLIYQDLACRMWGRSAFYQAGGAYGFRDQLQDCMALLLARPEIAREHILRAAAQQYVEGDVQHWWHPGSNKGIRTRFADDLLWLPLVAAKYVEVTGDTSIWREEVGFLEEEPLRQEEQERFGVPRRSSEKASLLEHCWRAIDRRLRFGEHGLPLMGSGDWNDGMNKVGWQGSGESVWMGWFLYTILTQFVSIAEAHNDSERARRYRREAKRLARAIDDTAWDGEWYRRAYFDDGTPLGSASNEECRIDSISQSWAVISGAADPKRAQEAMRAVGDYLVRKEDKLILLLTPAFDKMNPDPGYIRSYVPGVRENGGQYTHAAMWVIMATAILGQGDRAVELFDLVNPIHHALDYNSALQYRVEPYVVPADVAAVSPNTGRGGWTWYTGAASWMYQVAVEWILGLKVRGKHFTVAPCVPSSWDQFTITYRFRSTIYEITVMNPDGVETGVAEVRLDGTSLAEKLVPLRDDGGEHRVTVIMGGKETTDKVEEITDIDDFVSVT